MTGNKNIFKRKKIELLLAYKRNKNKVIYPVVKSLIEYLDKLDKKVNNE